MDEFSNFSNLDILKCVWISVVFVFSFMIGLLVIAQNKRFSRSYKRLNILSLSLLLSSFIYTVTILSVEVVTCFTRKWTFGGAYCKISGYLSCVYFGGVMGNISVNLLQKFLYMNTSLTTSCYVESKHLIIIVWLFQFALVSVPFIVLEDAYVFSPVYFSCIPNWVQYKPLSLLWVLVSYLIPISMMVFFGAFFYFYKLNKLKRIWTEQTNTLNGFDTLMTNVSGYGTASNIIPFITTCAWIFSFKLLFKQKKLKFFREQIM